MSIWWKLGGAAVALAAAFLLIRMYGSAQYKSGRADEASAWQFVAVDAERAKLKAYQDGVASVMNADKQYIETVREKIIPVTKTIVERTNEYAKTPDGLSICLDPERVHEAETFTSGLFASADARELEGSVPPDSLESQPRR